MPHDSPALRELSRSARSDPATPRGRRAGIVIGLVVVGAVGVLAAPHIADAIAAILPGRARIRGLGTNFDEFEAVAPTIIRRSGVALILVALVVAVASMIEQRPRSRLALLGREDLDRPRWVRPTLQVAVAVATGVWYGWLADPHNAYRSNARFHWVDFPTFDSDRFVYVAGRIPHIIFYDVPFLWQAINVAIVVLTLAWIGNRLRLSLTASLLLCVSPAIASNVLLFADTSEDVMLNLALLLALVAAMLTRRPVLIGIALTVAALGRPSFLVLTACVAGAEVIVAARSTDIPPGERLRRVDWRFVVTSLGTAVATTFALQALFSVLGDRYLLTNGRLVNTENLDRIEPTVVDGFTISTFSGTYVLHLLWVMPLVLLVGGAISIIIARRYESAVESTAYFCGLAVSAMVLVHELKPLGYYNIRYLTYVWPFLLVLSWMAFARLSRSRSLPWRAGVATALVLGLMVLPVDPIGVKRRIEAQDGTELFAIRHEVDRLVGDGDVIITFGGTSSRNVIAYVIRDSPGRVRIATVDEVGEDSVIITQRSSPIPDRRPVLETDSLLIYAPTAPPNVEPGAEE